MAINKPLKLPIGVQTFSDIRERGYYYVDKTPVVHRLIEAGKYYFLSRPRRFDKSLLLDTLRCLFEGRQALFEGLYIHDSGYLANNVLKHAFVSGETKVSGG